MTRSFPLISAVAEAETAFDGFSPGQFFKATDPLLPSGLLGPVQILPAEVVRLENAKSKDND